MVDTALGQNAGRQRMAYEVRRLDDRARLRELLREDWPYTAYALGQLEPGLFEQAQWWTSRGETGSLGVVLHSRGGLGPAVVTFGDPAAVNAILHLHPGPRFSFATFKLEHKQAAERHYILSRKQPMQRMGVTAETFRPVRDDSPQPATVRQLRGDDVDAVNRLYSVEGGPTNYSRANIEEGVYYGVIVEGRLVSIAGTHTVAASERIAVVGNVLTHPRHRGQGYATLATSAVTEHLLQVCENVLLTVESSNLPALRVYQKLGYQTKCNLYETSVVRRQMFGLLGVLRRLAARRRGHALNAEVVALSNKPTN